MNLSAIKKQIDTLCDQVEGISSINYSCERDKNGNLYINFDNGEIIKFPLINFRPYQIQDQIALFVNNIKKIVIQYPRRSGKEVESWNFICSAAIETQALYLMVYPTNVRAREILWEGQITLPDGSSYLFLDMIPKKLISKKNDANMTINLKNGSRIWIIGSDVDPHKLRGTNPRGAVLAEFAYCNPNILYTLLPIFRQNNGWFLCQSTFDGNNHFYRLLKNNEKNEGWYCRDESIETLIDENGNRYITDEMIDEDRQAGMPEYLIQQEYYGKVQINQETRYFAYEINYLDNNEKIVSNLILYNTPCYTASDFGMRDDCTWIIFQLDEIGNPVIIDYFKNNNKGLDFYLNECKLRVTRLGLYIKYHLAPHDADSVKFPHITTAVDMARDFGEVMLVTQKPYRKLAAIQQMRKMLYRCRFNKEKTDKLIDCLSNYEKEYDEKRNVYKDNPLHNWASHGVDAFQTMTLAIDDGMVGSLSRNVIYNLS